MDLVEAAAKLITEEVAEGKLYITEESVPLETHSKTLDDHYQNHADNHKDAVKRMQDYHDHYAKKVDHLKQALPHVHTFLKKHGYEIHSVGRPMLHGMHSDHRDGIKDDNGNPKGIRVDLHLTHKNPNSAPQKHEVAGKRSLDLGEKFHAEHPTMHLALNHFSMTKGNDDSHKQPGRVLADLQHVG